MRESLLWLGNAVVVLGGIASMFGLVIWIGLSYLQAKEYPERLLERKFVWWGRLSLLFLALRAIFRPMLADLGLNV